MPRTHPLLCREQTPTPASAQPRAAAGASLAPAATLPDTRAQARFSGRQEEPGALERGVQSDLENGPGGAPGREGNRPPDPQGW